MKEINITVRTFASVLALLLCSCAPPTGMYHVVREGQTLSEIAAGYAVQVERLGYINGISDLNLLVENQRIFVPGPHRRYKGTAKGRVPIEPISQRGSKKASVAVNAKRSLNQGSKSLEEKKKTSLVGKTKMLWPAQGRVVKQFNSSGKTPSRGIDIAVMASDEVRAAAAGEIIYAGNGVNGMRNVVIIQHKKSLFTVYGYNKNILAQKGEFVSAGQKIALAGRGPGENGHLVHFQVRTGKSPVDPLRYLAMASRD